MPHFDKTHRSSKFCGMQFREFNAMYKIYSATDCRIARYAAALTELHSTCIPTAIKLACCVNMDKFPNCCNSFSSMLAY